MKFMVLAALFLLCLAANAMPRDTIFVEDATDPRYRRFLDSMHAYKISYSVAKNMADTVAKRMGNRNLDDYFFGRFSYESDTMNHGYFYFFETGVEMEIGHVSEAFKGMADEAKFPWEYLEAQYKRLDSIRIQPWGVMQGGELPNVYIYRKPLQVVVYRKVRHFTMIDHTIQFSQADDGKTKTSFIRKYYYNEIDKGRPRIDSIEKLDPLTLKRIGILQYGDK